MEDETGFSILLLGEMGVFSPFYKAAPSDVGYLDLPRRTERTEPGGDADVMP